MTASEGLQTGSDGSDTIEIGATGATLEERAPAGSLLDDLRAAVLPWLVSRALVVAALVLARRIYDDVGRLPRPVQLGQGLFAWDGAFYRAIAEDGFRAAGRASLRFFPLVPMISRGLGWVLPGHEATALIIVANASALVFLALLHHLTLRETGDASVARVAVWFAALVPVAAVLVMGYAEATAMMLGVAMFLMLRTRRFGWAALFGLLAGLCRPVGVLLVVPAVVEVVREWRGGTTRQRVAGVGAIASPFVGLLIFLAWVGAEFGDAGLPITEQNKDSLRGGFQDPFTRTYDAVRDAFHHHFGSVLHLAVAVVLVALVVVLARRLPASYAWYAGATILLGISAHNLDSFERYAMSTFPFVMAAALVVRREGWVRAAVALGGGSLFALSLLYFLGIVGP
jgi:hypothetical protein